MSVLLPDQLAELADVNHRFAVPAGGAPVVEVVAELPVAAHHEVRLEPRPGEAVVHAGPLHAPQGGLGYAVGPFRGVVLDAGALRNAGADTAADHHHAVVVVDLHPVVVLEADGGRILLAEPEGILSPRQGGHA